MCVAASPHYETFVGCVVVSCSFCDKSDWRWYLAKWLAWIIIKTHPIRLVYHISHSVIDKYQHKTNTLFFRWTDEYGKQKRKKSSSRDNKKCRRSCRSEETSVSERNTTPMPCHPPILSKSILWENRREQNYLFTFLFHKFKINKQKNWSIKNFNLFELIHRNCEGKQIRREIRDERG